MTKSVFQVVNKFVLEFLSKNSSQDSDVVDEWIRKNNKLKSVLKKIDNPKTNPSRPASEYIHFCQEVRPRVQEEMRSKNPDKQVNIHEVTCELGKRWQQFKKCQDDPELKARIEELARLDRERYRKEKAATTPEKQVDEKKHLRSKYLFFCYEKRMENPTINMKTLGMLWAVNKDDPNLSERYESLRQKLMVVV
jgi:hypothetical protein